MGINLTAHPQALASFGRKGVALGAVKEFFAVRSARSEVKTEIVRKYFSAWARIMANQVRKKGGDRVGYADLFSGRGRYEDGSKSTPLLIVEGAIRDSKIRDMLVCLFNDEDKENADALAAEIARLDGVGFLKHQPIVDNRKIDDRLAEHLAQDPGFFGRADRQAAVPHIR